MNSSNIEKILEKNGRNQPLYEACHVWLAERKKLEEKWKNLNSEKKKELGEKKEEFINKPLIHPHAKCLVKRIKIIESGDLIPVARNPQKNRGLANRGGMIRVDIFRKPNEKGKVEFFMIPVYRHHCFDKELPNRICTINKPETEWIPLDKSYNFVFSLYPDEYVEIVKDNNEKEKTQGYYVKVNRHNAQICIRPHDNSENERNYGLQSLRSITKFEIDLLGGKHEVLKGGIREPLAKSRS